MLFINNEVYAEIINEVTNNKVESLNRLLLVLREILVIKLNKDFLKGNK